MRKSLMLIGAALALIAAPVVPASGDEFRFTHGVASGDVTDTAALLWTRTSAHADLVVQVARDRTFRGAVIEPVTATAERDYTVEVEVSGLVPRTRYFYRFVRLPNGPVSRVGQFVTGPGSGQDIHFVYSGDSDGTPTAEGVANFRDTIAAVADAMRRERPDLFIYLGDTIYSDSGLAPAAAMTLDAYRAKYREVRAIAELRNLLASVGLVAMWDDHEVVNDYAPTVAPVPFPPVLFPPSLTPARVAAGQRAFREWFPVREGAGGVAYRSIRYGPDLLLIVLDDRSYRSNPLPVLAACDVDPGTAIVPDLAPTLPQPLRNAFSALVPPLAVPVSPACLTALRDPARTMLGAAQKAWLMDTLSDNNAAFSVIINEVPVQELFVLPYDRWEGFAAEREEVLRFIRDTGKRVVWLTTDTHAHIANDVNVRTFTGAFPELSDTYEVITGPMGTHTFADEIEAFLRSAGLPPESAAAAVAVFGDFLRYTLAAECVELDRPGYAVVDLDSLAGTLTIRPRAPALNGPVDLCPAPVVVTR